MPLAIPVYMGAPIKGMNTTFENVYNIATET